MPSGKILAIIGPTASGKTDVSFSIARLISQKLGSEAQIISADSRQIYKYIPIASSYPPEDYLRKVKHYFTGELEPQDEFNAGEFGNRAREIIRNVLGEGKIPIIVGGSGLYISSLIYGLFDYDEAMNEREFKEKQKRVRQKLTERIESEGLSKLFDELKNADKLTAEKMDNITPRRLIRALEVYYMTGIPLSTLQQKKTEIGFEAVQFALRWDRELLYNRINKRVDIMLENGLIEEVKSLQEKGYDYEKNNSLNSVGIKEVFDYINGKTDYETMVELIKRNTRRFAKRQMTWFRKDKSIKWIDVKGEGDMKSVAEKIFNLFFEAI